MDKKAMDWSNNWVEYLFIILTIIGFIIGILATSVIINYIISLLLGVIIGRIFYLKRKYLPFPRYLIAAGLILGFLVGSYRANWKGLLLIFLIGAYTSYKLHKNNIIKEYF